MSTCDACGAEAGVLWSLKSGYRSEGVTEICGCCYRGSTEAIYTYRRAINAARVWSPCGPIDYAPRGCVRRFLRSVKRATTREVD